MPRAIVAFALAIALTITLATPLVGQAQTAAKPTLEERLARAAAENAVRLGFDGRTFSGPGWDRLVSEGRAAQAFLLGEEHGIAENPKLAAALFEALVPAGYARFVIEVSWPMADALDGAARQGVAGLRRQFAEPGGEPAFFGMKEEAEMLVAVRAAVPGDVPVFWGVDYEVGGDRLLLSRLADRAVPASASAPLARLRDAASAAWAEHAASGDISKAFSFAGDPALVVAVRDAWPAPDAETHRLLDALEQTLQINRLWVERRRYDSNRRRADFLRANFRAHWQSAASAGPVPRVFAKLGASHLVRGLNPNEVFDIGTLAPELAEAAGGRTFHLMVLPGRGAPVAVLDPSKWRYMASTPKDGYMKGLDPILGAAHADAFTLIDLRPLRPLLGFWSPGTDPELMRTVHGYDMLLVMTGSSASSNLRAAER